MNNTYIYSRQSSGDEERSISVEEQISNCKHLAEVKGLDVKEIYQDLNTSGRLYWCGAENIAQMDIVYQNWVAETKKKNQFRLGLGNLFAELKKGDVIIVDDITRLYRPLTNSYLESALIQFLLSKEIKIYTVKNGELNLTSFNDNLINALQNRINDNQLALQRKKCKDSYRRLKDSGEHIQSIHKTFGYTSTGRKYEIEIVPREAEAVKFIFNSYLNGVGVFKITKEINSNFKDILKTGHTTAKTIKSILARPLYAGYTYNSNGELIKSKEVEGKELIDFTTWNEANNLLNKNRTHRKPKKKYTYFFNGLCKCGYCGSNLNVVINHKKYFSLRCPRHISTNYPNCKVSIGLNSVFEHGLGMNAAITPILILGLLKKLQEQNNQEALKSQIESNKIELNNITNKEKQLSTMFLEGLIEQDVLKTVLNQNKAKKSAIEQEIIKLEHQAVDVDKEEVRALTSKVFNRKLTDNEYNRLVQQTIKEIKVYHDKIEVETYFGSITLPRKKVLSWLALPTYIWSNTPGHYRLYYYYNAPNIYAPKQKLFDNKELAIYLIEETQ